MKLFVPALIITASLALTTGALAADSKTSTTPATKAVPATPATKTTPATKATPATPASKAAPKQVTGTKEECEKAYAAETHHKKSKANFMKACVKPAPKT